MERKSTLVDSVSAEPEVSAVGRKRQFPQSNGANSAVGKKLSIVNCALLIVFCLFFGGKAWGQSPLTVCDGTTTNSYVPFYGYMGDAAQHNQMIYPGTNLTSMVGKLITEMSFYVSSGSTTLNDWDISLGTTTASTLSELDNTTSLTQVYSGSLSVSGGIMTIIFDDGWIYNGNNILVDFNHFASNWDSYTFYGVSADGASYTYGSQRNFLPKVSFTYVTPCNTPANFALVADSETSSSADVSWTGDNDSFIVQYAEVSSLSSSVQNVTFLDEGFEGGSLPSGWTKDSYWNIGTGSGNSSGTSSAGTGSYNAYCYRDSYDGEYYLITPEMDLSQATSASLSFNLYNSSWGSDINELYVYYRVNGGSWNTLASYTSQTSGWESKTITLTGLDVRYQIGFYCVNNYSYGTAIDDILITGVATVTTYDWQTASSNATSPYTIGGLDDGTDYLARIIGVCNGNQTDPSDAISFTTLASASATHISTEADWNQFCMQVNGCHDFQGETVYLDADISPTSNAMVGTQSCPFRGTFNGQGHKITVSIENTADQGVAPFHYIDGATIKNLEMGGTVTARKHHAAGLVGFCASGSTNVIQNCLVHTNVTNNNSGCGDDTNNYMGGLIGHNMNATTSIIGCVYDGTLTSQGFKGGMVGFADNGYSPNTVNITIKDCYFGGNYSANGYSYPNFSPVAARSAHDFIMNLTSSNFYYNTDAGTFFSAGYSYEGNNNNSNDLGYIPPKHAYTVTGATGVTVAMRGLSTIYNVSGITAYNNGMVYEGNIYGGEGDNIALKLSCSSVFDEYLSNYGTLSGSAVSGTEDEYTLTMEANNTIIRVKICQTMGTGSETAYLINTSYGCTYSQHIYTADELTAMGFSAGDITAVSFCYSGSSSSYSKTQSIYIGTTTQSSYSGYSASDFVGDLDLVYGPTLLSYASGWREYEFTEPFDWDGTSNIVIGVLTNSTHSSSSGWDTKGTSTGSDYRSIYRYQDSSPIDIDNLSSVSSGNRFATRPNIRLCIDPPASCPRPRRLSASDIYATEVTLNWTERGSATTWILEYGTAVDFAGATSVTVNTNSTKTLTGLTAETTYYARVKANCGVGDESEWSDVCIFTPSSCLDFDVIGDGGTTTSSDLPSQSYYNYSLTQQIYTPCEIGTAGDIGSISFYNGGTTKTRTYDIYLKQTDKTEFSGTTDWITVVAGDKAFSGSVTMTAGEWTTIIFETPFNYDGASNLAVIIDDNTGSWESGMACRTYPADGNQTICHTNDNDNQNPLSPSYAGTLLSVKNQVRFNICDRSVLPSVTITANATAGGSVAGGGSYDVCSEATVTATPSACYKFVNWTVGDNEEVSTSASYTFTVTSARTVKANFAEWEINPNATSESTECIVSGTELVLTAGTDITMGDFETGTDALKWLSPTLNFAMSNGYHDDDASDILDIGFTFSLYGNDYTQFSVNSNGQLRLGNEANGGDYRSAPFSSSNAGALAPKIIGIGCDLGTGNGGYVKYGVSGTEPNRILVCEFAMGYTYGNSYTPDVKWQVQLFETSNKIQIVYSSLVPNYVPSGFQIGFCTGIYDVVTIDPSDHSINTGVTSTTYSNWPGANRYYSFTPRNISYAWDYSGTSGSASGNTYTVSPTEFTNTYTASVTVNGCTKSAEQIVTVKPTITSITANPATICKGNSSELSVSSNAASYSWNNDAGDGSSVTVSPTSTTTYRVSATKNECFSTSTVKVIVKEKLEPTFSAVGPYCIGETPGALPACTATDPVSGSTITGHWEPATITTDASRSYAFVVDGGQCAVDGSLSVTVNPPTADVDLASFDYIWKGGSTDWNTAGNWYMYNSGSGTFSVPSTLPSEAKNYYIGTGTTCLPSSQWPTLSGDAIVNNITISSGTVTVDANKTLSIAGSISGTITAESGSTIEFVGSSDQTINDSQTFSNVTFSKDGANEITATGGLIVNGTATFTKGIVTGNVTFGSGATVSGASTSSYVNGKVTRNGMSGAFTFPTGTATLYAPFKATSSSASNVSVQYAAGHDGMPDWWNHSGNLYDAGLNHASDRENWQLSASASTELSSIILYWNESDNHSFEEGNEALNSYLNVAAVKRNGFNWQNLGRASIEGDYDGSGSITAAEPLVIEISGAKAAGEGDYFVTFASSNNNLVLPIELTSFSATCDGRSALVEWSTASERNNDYFSLERSDDAISFVEVARVAGAGNSIEPIDYAYNDYGIHGGDNYYRLVQVDYDGTRTVSEVIVANCIEPESDGEPEVLAYPNPFSSELTVVLDNFGNRAATIEVYDMLGKLIYTNKISAPQNSYETILNLSNLPPAAYTVRVSTNDFVINRNVVKN